MTTTKMILGTEVLCAPSYSGSTENWFIGLQCAELYENEREMSSFYGNGVDNVVWRLHGTLNRLRSGDPQELGMYHTNTNWELQTTFATTLSIRDTEVALRLAKRFEKRCYSLYETEGQPEHPCLRVAQAFRATKSQYFRIRKWNSSPGAWQPVKYFRQTDVRSVWYSLQEFLVKEYAQAFEPRESEEVES